MSLRLNTSRSVPRTLLPVLALLLLPLAACQPPAGETDSASQAILLPVPSDPTISFSLYVKAGSQNDPEGKEGLAALTGNLIAQGATMENSWDAILEKLYPLATQYSVRVDKEMTAFTGRIHRDNLDAFFGLYTDAYLKPAFNEDDFNRVRGNLLNYLEKTLRYASDEELGKAALTDFAFQGTPYQHPIAGTVAGLNALTVDDVKAFYQAHYTRGNVEVALGGGFDDALVQRFEATLEQLPEGDAVTPPTVTPAAIEGRHVLLVDKADADASISFGFPIDVSRGDDDFYALWVANSWLGEHRNSSSHLYQVIREDRGMNYGDYSYIEAFPEGGFRQMPPANVARRHQIFEVWIRTLPNEQAVFATRAALRELTNLVENGMSEEDFELTRSFLSKYYLHFAESTEERLGYAVDDAFYGIEAPGHLARFGERIAQVTREEVNAAIQKHWQVDNIKIAIVTGDAENLAQILQNDTLTPMSYSIEKPEEILEEDKEIEAFPLGIAENGVTTVPVDEMFAQ